MSRDGEETTLEGRNSFWTKWRVLFLLAFAAGVLVGAYVTSHYLDPAVYAARSADYNSLSALNQSLDQRSDQLYACLLKNNVKPGTCNT